MPFGKAIPKVIVSFPDGSVRPYPYRISVDVIPLESKNTIEKTKSLLLEYRES